MSKTQTITVPIDELACFITNLLAVALMPDVKKRELNYDNLKMIRRLVTKDLKSADFSSSKEEYNETLWLYKLADDIQYPEPAKGE